MIQINNVCNNVMYVFHYFSTDVTWNIFVLIKIKIWLCLQMKQQQLGICFCKRKKHEKWKAEKIQDGCQVHCNNQTN